MAKKKIEKIEKNSKITRRKKKAVYPDKYFISYVPEIKLLEKGKLPHETKMGSEFKGKNRIIISK